MNLIQLIGVGDNNYNNLKENIAALLSNQTSKRDVVLEEVNDIDTIMEFNLNSIPALAVNGRIIFEQNASLLTKERLREIIAPYIRKVNMKNILVPTDFSEVAGSAFDFAYDLAATNNGSVKVIHVSHPSFDTANPMGTYVPGTFEGIKRGQLAQFLNRIPNGEEEQGGAESIALTSEVVIGFASEEIIRYSKEADVDMIVMGTTGEGGFLNKLVGSVSSRVAQQAWCPVMLIPQGHKKTKFDNILYASNHQAIDEVMIREMVDFALLHEANIHLLHVKESTKAANLKVIRKAFERIVITSAPNLSYQYTIVGSKSAYQGIQRYIQQNDIDLMSVVTAHRGFVEDLFHKSVTKKLVFNLNIPLLVMHWDQ